MHTYSGYNAPLILLSCTAGWHEAEGSYVSYDLSEGKQTFGIWWLFRLRWKAKNVFVVFIPAIPLKLLICRNVRRVWVYIDLKWARVLFLLLLHQYRVWMTTSVLVVKVVSYPGPKAWEELLIDFHLLEQQEAASLGQKDQEVLDPACHLLRCLPQEGLCAWLSPPALALLVARELLRCLIFSPLRSAVWFVYILQCCRVHELPARQVRGISPSLGAWEQFGELQDCCCPLQAAGDASSQAPKLLRLSPLLSKQSLLGMLEGNNMSRLPASVLLG